MTNKLTVSAAPHIRNNVNTRVLMIDFLISLIPVLFIATLSYGSEFIILLLSTVLMAYGMDKFFCLVLKLKSEKYALSSVISGVLLLLTFSIKTPLWIVFIGLFFSLFFGKFIFGGMGQNIFNPALLGKVILIISFPHYMIQEVSVDNIVFLNSHFIKSGGVEFVREEITKGIPLGSLSIMAIFLGYIYLAIRKRIEWKNPIIALLTIFFGAYLLSENSLSYIFSQGVIFGCIYFLTDSVTSPVTRGGKIFHGVLVGLTFVLIRKFSEQPEAMVYALLFGNAVSPLVSKLFKPRVFGRKRDMKEILNLIKVLLIAFIGIYLLNLVDTKYSSVIESKRENLVFGEMKKLVPKGERFDLYNESKYYDGFLFIPVYDSTDNKIAYIVRGKTKGYKDRTIEFLLGIDLKGKTLGHRILKHQETLGIGSKLADKEYEKLWVNKDINSYFDKTIDVPSGATYTFLNFFKTVKEILGIYEDKFLKEPVVEKKVIIEKIVEKEVTTEQAIEVAPSETTLPTSEEIQQKDNIKNTSEDKPIQKEGE